MSNVIIPLLVWKEGNEVQFDAANVTPEVKYVPQESILEVKKQTSGIGFGSQVVVSTGGGFRKVYHCFESPLQITALENPATDNYFAKSEIALGLDAAGSAQGAGVAILKFFNTVDAATDSSAEAFDLPAATKGAVHIVVNETAVALEGFPDTDETINGAAANAVYDHAANKTVYYYCTTAGAWRVLVVS